MAQIIDLTSQEFHQRAINGELDLIIDVRTLGEWNTGHVENATLIENLSQQLDLTPISDINRTLDSLGIRQCLSCTTLVYCRSGARASRALSLLRNKAGFQGPLYNGQGTSQWTAAGFELVNTPSLVAPCMQRTENELPVCARQGTETTIDPTTSEPTTVAVPPTPAPNSALPIRKEAPLESKCGSLANDRGVGGAAAQAKGCSRVSSNGGGGRIRHRLRGL